MNFVRLVASSMPMSLRHDSRSKLTPVFHSPGRSWSANFAWQAY
jgi:hypothetical protein